MFFSETIVSLSFRPTKPRYTQPAKRCHPKERTGLTDNPVESNSRWAKAAERKNMHIEIIQKEPRLNQVSYLGAFPHCRSGRKKALQQVWPDGAYYKVPFLRHRHVLWGKQFAERA